MKNSFYIIRNVNDSVSLVQLMYITVKFRYSVAVGIVCIFHTN